MFITCLGSSIYRCVYNDVMYFSFLGNQLSHVSDVHFAYFSRTTECAGHKNGDVFPIKGHPKGGITIHISRREPFTKLSEEGNNFFLYIHVI